MVNGPQLMFSAAARAKTVNAVFKSDDKIDDLKVCDAKGRASTHRDVDSVQGGVKS
jgi:hypothetical protein